MRRAFLGALLGIATCWSAAGCSPEATRTLSRPPTGRPVLHLAATKVVKGDERLKFQISVTNAGGAPVTLINPVDGAEDGMRCVSYEWKVERADGAPIKPRGYGRCGNTNTIRTDDFTTIAPGATSKIAADWLAGPGMKLDLTPAGVYRVRLIYKFERPKGSADGDGIRGGIEQGTAQDLLKQTAEVTVASNWVEITRQ